MFIPGVQLVHLTAIETQAHFPYARIYSLLRNCARGITPNKVFRNRISCAVPSGRALSHPSSSCPKHLVSGLSSRPLYEPKRIKANNGYQHNCYHPACFSCSCLCTITFSSISETAYIPKQKSFQEKYGINGIINYTYNIHVSNGYII